MLRGLVADGRFKANFGAALRCLCDAVGVGGVRGREPRVVCDDPRLGSVTLVASKKKTKASDVLRSPNKLQPLLNETPWGIGWRKHSGTGQRLTQ